MLQLSYQDCRIWWCHTTTHAASCFRKWRICRSGPMNFSSSTWLVSLPRLMARLQNRAITVMEEAVGYGCVCWVFHWLEVNWWPSSKMTPNFSLINQCSWHFCRFDHFAETSCERVKLICLYILHGGGCRFWCNYQRFGRTGT